MTSEAQAVIDEVAALAIEKGWEGVTQACEALRQKPGDALRLAFAEGVDRAVFQAWVERLDVGVDTTSQDLDEFSHSPIAALAGGKLVAVFSAHDFPTAKDMDTYNRVVAPLPPQVRCVVLIADPAKGPTADVEAVHKMAQALFGADPGTAGARPELAKDGIYLWTAGPVDRTDGHVELRTALEAPLRSDAAAERAVLAADLVLGRVSDALRSEEAARPLAPAKQTSWRAGDQEDALRARLRQTVEDLDRDLRTSVQATSSALQAEVAAVLAAGGPGAGEVARRAVEARLGQTRQELTDVFANAADLWTDSLDRILGEVPWAMFNTPEGLDRPTLLADLAFDSGVDGAIFAVDEPSRAGGFSVPSPRGHSIPGGLRPISVLGGAVVGLGLGAKYGAVGMGVGVAVGAASGLMIAEQVEAGARRGLQHQWREAVARWTRRAESDMSLRLTRMEQTLNETLRVRLRALGDLVEKACQRPEASASGQTDWARLEVWRRRLHPDG